ncbi:MAG: 2-C-methyl-D-erythritol 4-phosphate cytidylyltransferase [Eubacterium sp.]
MSNIAIILGAGNGTRMKSEKSKLLLEVGGLTVIERTVKTFFELDEIDRIIVVCRECDKTVFSDLLKKYNVSLCIGGSTRQQSVLNALELVDECELLIIHDGARPLVSKKAILDTLRCAKLHKAAATGVFVKDTIKVVGKDMKIIDTPDRSTLVSIQTPQIFDYDTYIKAVELAKQQGRDFTDDCQLAENMGVAVFAVEGDYSNIKITTPDDIPLAENILKIKGES